MKRAWRGSRSLRRGAVAAACVAAIALGGRIVAAEPDVTAQATKQAVEEASRSGCDGVSVVVQRCAPPVDAPTKKAPDDALTRSRTATKAAFDRRDRNARDAALQGANVPASTPVGDAQRLGTVTVTGKAADPQPTLEEVLQRALNPGSLVSPDGTVSHYAPDGVRYDCIAKCVGPMCCATVRTLPNPARDSNSIGR